MRWISDENMGGILNKVVDRMSAERVLDLASKLIKIPSVNPPGNTKEIAEIVKDYLESNGISADLYEPSPGKVNVVARIGDGREDDALILNGHMDVVPVGDESRWSFPPFSGEVKGEFLLGRGASDMKGGLAGIIEAFIAASKFEGEFQRPVILACVADEETGGKFGTEYLLEKGITRGSDVLIAEPTGLDSINIGEKGVLWSKIKIRGRPGHGSLAPYVGENAITKACEVIRELLKVTEIGSKLPEELDEVVGFSRQFVERRGGRGAGIVLDHVTINVGLIRGGVKVNVVPDLCEVELDMRIPIGLPSSKVIEFIKEVLERYRGELEVVASSEANYTSPRCEIVRSLKKVISEILGLEARPFLQIASSDARFYREKGIPTIHYGPGELETVHGYDEKVKVGDLIKAARIYAGVIAEYSLQPR